MQYNKTILWGGIALLMLGGCSMKTSTPADVIYDQAPSMYHVVNSGDTLQSIASQHGVSLQSIIQLNKIKDATKIMPGQILLLRPQQMNAIHPQTTIVEDDVEVLDEPATEEESADSFSNDSTLVEVNEDEPSEAVNIALTWPVRGRILQPFATSGQNSNNGINIAAPKKTPVRAAASGKVTRVGKNIKDFGNVVLIQHADDLITIYAHLDQVLVKEGAPVAQGDKIGTVGNSGATKQTQLHFELRKDRQALDPALYLK